TIPDMRFQPFRWGLLALALAVTCAAQNMISVPGTRAVARTWASAEGTWWQESADGGATFSEPRLTSFDLMLRYAQFDPLVSQPQVPADLASAAASRLWIVQYAAPPLPEMREQVALAGARDVAYLPRHADIVDVDPAALATIGKLPFVRWV